MKEEWSYIKALDEAIREYADSPHELTLFGVLTGIFDGIGNNYSLRCPIGPSEDGKSVGAMYLKKENGKEHLVLLTTQKSEKYEMIADVWLSSIVSLVFDRDSCEGIVFNPGEENSFFLPKRFLGYALSAGYKIAENEILKDGQ